MCSNRCMCSGWNNGDSCNNWNNGINNFSNISGSSSSGFNGANGSSGFRSSNFNNTSMNFGNAYVPWQTFNNVFTPANGLANGTMFPELVSPYYPNQSLETMNYLRFNSNGGSCCRNNEGGCCR